MDKIDLKKQLTHLYEARADMVCEVDVPTLQFLMVGGRGDPNTAPAYQAAVEALFAQSYAIKFLVKKDATDVDYGARRPRPAIKMFASSKVINLAVAASLCAPSTLAAQETAGAADVIHQVNSAARRKDFEALRRLMTNEFRWTLGPGSETAEQAITVWKVNRHRLEELVAATNQRCEVLEPSLIQCPAGAGIGFRAGFRQIDGAWKMRYFLAGD